MVAVAPSALIWLLLKSTSGVTFTRWTAVPVWPAPSVALHVTVLAPGRKWVGLAVPLWPFTCVTVAVMPSSAVAVPLSTGVKRPIASTVISAGAVTSGPLTGVTLLEGGDAALSPAELVATAVNIYAVPSVKPVTGNGLDGPMAVMPPGAAVTEKLVMAAPPLNTGAVKLTLA